MVTSLIDRCLITSDRGCCKIQVLWRDGYRRYYASHVVCQMTREKATGNELENGVSRAVPKEWILDINQTTATNSETWIIMKF
jgi:hypothetical protein